MRGQGRNQGQAGTQPAGIDLRLQVTFKDKAAAQAYRKAWLQANKEASAAQRKAYRQANKEAIAARDKAYRQANKEAIAAREKAYRQANKEAIAAREKAWKQANKEAIAARDKDRVNKLVDRYVAAALCMSAKDCPPDLIELKREQIRISRLTKQLTKLIKEKTNGTK